MPPRFKAYPKDDYQSQLFPANDLFPVVLPRFYLLKRRWTMMTAAVTKGTYPKAPITVRHPNPSNSPQ